MPLQFLQDYQVLISASIAASFALVSISKQRQTAREKNSLDFEASYKNDEAIQQAWVTIGLIVDNRLITPIDHWATGEGFHTKESRAIRSILNEWERVANGIEHKLYDSHFLYRSYGSLVLQLDLHLKPFIRARQRENPRLYRGFTRLALAWYIKRSKEDHSKYDQQLKAAYKVIDRSR